jgi:hypothetical protein
MNQVAVELEQQVVEFVRALPPQPRQALRRALKNLQLERGDIRALEGERGVLSAPSSAVPRDPPL